MIGLRKIGLLLGALWALSACVTDEAAYDKGFQAAAANRMAPAKTGESDSTARYRLADLSPGTRPALDTDEAGLWMQMDKAENDLKSSGHLVRDPALNAYVNRVVCRVAGEFCSDIRTYIVDVPLFNASMAPNGVMQIWTGLFLRVHNEAQFAGVVGHEVAHYLRRHSIQRFRDVIEKTNALLVFQFISAAAGVPIAGDLVALAAIGSIQSFSREHEREADGYGLMLLHKAGYDVREMSKVWKNLKRERKALKDKPTRGFFLASHPESEEREAELARLAASMGADVTAYTGRDEFLSVVEPLRTLFLREELARRTFSSTEELLKILEQEGHNRSEVLFFRGELFRMRGGDGDGNLALAAYEEAISEGNPPVELYRSMGRVLRKAGRREEAARSFARYLELMPGAPDRQMIQFIIGGGT